jgi:FAD/FMN-containing dehydrogenase
MSDERAAHEARKARLVAGWPAEGDAPLGLTKRSSNLFRDRAEPDKRRLDLDEFCHVIEVRPAEGWVDVEGLTTYAALVDATLPHGVMPAVVPQLKTITAGGAVAGVGIEATSFRHGLVHDTMLEIDVLLPSGQVVRCTPSNEHRELFFGFPNSYGTLGYALRLRLRTQPVRGFVHVQHRRHREPRQFLADMAAHCDGPADFVDGVVFGPDAQVLSVGRFVDTVPWASDYGFERIYYRSLRERADDYLSTRDYLWRWDTDWFWCSKNVGAQHWLVRRLLGRARLNSATYTRIMRWNARHGWTRRVDRWLGRHSEPVIQDVDIPWPHAEAFVEFLLREIDILPVWACPVRAGASGARFPLYPMPAAGRYLNFGFWDVKRTPVAFEPGHFNRLVERKVLELGGIKSLYSDSWFTREEFAQAYDLAQHAALQRRYDPQHRLLGLYEKCVGRA